MATRRPSSRCTRSRWRPLSILPGPMELWGSLLSTALFGAALCVLYRMTLGRYDEAMARRTVLYLSIFPLTFVFSLPYAESLFLLLALGAFALTWHGRGWAGARSARWRCSHGRSASRSCPRSPGGLPAARAAAAAVPAAAPAAARRGPVLRLSRVADGRLPGERARPGARLGARASVSCRTCSATRCGTTCSRPGICGSSSTWPSRSSGAGSSTRRGGCGCRREYLIFAALLILLPTSGGLLVSIGRFGMVAFPLFWALAELGESERRRHAGQDRLPDAARCARDDHVYGAYLHAVGLSSASCERR